MTIWPSKDIAQVIRLPKNAEELRIRGEDKVMICPFCRQSDLPDNSGSTICPVCNTEMEIDDRCECVFVNPEMPKMPVRGQVCTECGLVNPDREEHCLYCGNNFNQTVQ